MKQTAVEFLEQICKDRGYHLMSEYIEQAKDMEKEQNKMDKEEIKNDISVKSRLDTTTLTDEQLKIIDFIIDYSFKDKKEVYTNGTILVPLFRVLDAIAQNGEQYHSS